MEIFKLDSITVKLIKEENYIRVTTENENVIFINQSLENIKMLIGINFNIIRNHYKIISKDQNIIQSYDIDNVSIKIALHYLYMYNLWNNTNKNQNKELIFDEEDLKNPTTVDMLINYFLNRQADYWQIIVCLLSGIRKNEFQTYYTEREQFYNK